MQKPSEGEEQHENPYVKFTELEKDISTGDLAILKRPGEKYSHFAIFVQYGGCDPDFPILLVKGKTKPLPHFDPKVKRHAHLVSAVSRIFYGDYETVSIRSLQPPAGTNCHDTTKIVDEIASIPFSETEIEAIESAGSAEDRSAILCAFMIAHFYKKMGVLQVDPETIRPDTLQDNLSLGEPRYISLPPVREGPMAHGDPPFLSKLV